MCLHLGGALGVARAHNQLAFFPERFSGPRHVWAWMRGNFQNKTGSGWRVGFPNPQPAAAGRKSNVDQLPAVSKKRVRGRGLDGFGVSRVGGPPKGGARDAVGGPAPDGSGGLTSRGDVWPDPRGARVGVPLKGPRCGWAFGTGERPPPKALGEALRGGGPSPGPELKLVFCCFTCRGKSGRTVKGRASMLPGCGGTRFGRKPGCVG